MKLSLKRKMFNICGRYEGWCNDVEKMKVGGRVDNLSCGDLEIFYQ